MANNIEKSALQPISNNLNASGRTDMIKSIVLNTFQVNLYDRSLVWPEETDSLAQSAATATNATSTASIDSIHLESSLSHSSLVDLSSRPAPQIVSAKVNQALLKHIDPSPATSGVMFRSASTSALHKASDASIITIESNPFHNQNLFTNNSFASTLWIDSPVDELPARYDSELPVLDLSSLASYDTFTFKHSDCLMDCEMKKKSSLTKSNIDHTIDALNRKLNCEMDKEFYQSKDGTIISTALELTAEELYDDCEQLNSRIHNSQKSCTDNSTFNSISGRACLARTKSLNFHSLQQLDPLPEEEMMPNRNSLDCLIDLNIDRAHDTVSASIQNSNLNRCINSSKVSPSLPSQSYCITTNRLPNGRRNALLRPVGRVAGMLERLGSSVMHAESHHRPMMIPSSDLSNATTNLGIQASCNTAAAATSDNDSVTSSLQQRCDESGYESDGFIARIEAQNIVKPASNNR